jgi:hypothetical protein
LLTIAPADTPSSTGYYTYYSWAIAFGIFFKLANYFLLVVTVWSVNMLLRERLNAKRSLYKTVCLVILGVMGALTAAYIGLDAYNTWTVTPEGRSVRDSLADQETQLAVAYWVLFLVSVLAAGAMAVVSLLSLRSKQAPIGVRALPPTPSQQAKLTPRRTFSAGQSSSCSACSSGPSSK